MSENAGCTVVTAPIPEGAGRVDILVAEIEGGALGISFTEHDGALMRRVSVELTNCADIKAIHDVIGRFLSKHQDTQAEMK